MYVNLTSAGPRLLAGIASINAPDFTLKIGRGGLKVWRTRTRATSRHRRLLLRLRTPEARNREAGVNGYLVIDKFPCGCPSRIHDCLYRDLWGHEPQGMKFPLIQEPLLRGSSD